MREPKSLNDRGVLKKVINSSITSQAIWKHLTILLMILLMQLMTRFIISWCKQVLANSHLCIFIRVNNTVRAFFLLLKTLYQTTSNCISTRWMAGRMMTTQMPSSYIQRINLRLKYMFRKHLILIAIRLNNNVELALRRSW